jgi:protein-L-isoaspartate(D-aspartate) O-methyltransferase
VEELKAKGAIKSPTVKHAFRKPSAINASSRYFDFQQKDFDEVDQKNLKEEHLKTICSDTVLVTRVIEGIPASTTSQPSLVAIMVELLRLELSVLEIETGTGYNATLIREIVNEDGHGTTYIFRRMWLCRRQGFCLPLATRESR